MKKSTVALSFLLFAGNNVFAGSENAVAVSKAHIGEDWPFSVNSGVLKCLDIGNGSVIFQTGGKQYAINGIAKGFAKQHGFRAVEEIWLEDPRFMESVREIAATANEPVDDVRKSMGTPPRKNIGPILDKGSALCQ